MRRGLAAVAVLAASLMVGAAEAHAEPDHLGRAEQTVLVIEGAGLNEDCGPSGQVELRNDWGRAIIGRPRINSSAERVWILNRCPQDYELVGTSLRGQGRLTIAGNSRMAVSLLPIAGFGQLRVLAWPQWDPGYWDLEFH